MKKKDQSSMVILKHLLNTQMICKMFIDAFDDMIADMINNKKLNPIVNELFIRDRKVNILNAFITQSDFKVPKEVLLKTTHFFVMNIPNKMELQQNSQKHSSVIDFKDFMKIDKKNLLQESIPF